MSVLEPSEENIRGKDKPSGWNFYYGNTVYECRIAIVKDDEGYIAYSLNLPGTASQGDTMEEVIANITDALEGTIEYHKSNGDIPWKDELWFEGKVECEKRILVNA